MKILQVHSFYKEPGGEDSIVINEGELLESYGHQVIRFFRKNDEIDNFSLFDKIKLITETTWSKKTYDDIQKVILKTKPDVCHVHNTLPLISPSVYDACADLNIPVVQTLHNYRLICTSGLFLRNNKICEDCLGKSAYSSVLKKCYRNSAIQTYAVARMIEINKKNKRWITKVGLYLCATEFAKKKFIAHGFPENILTSHSNFAIKPTVTIDEKENFFLFVGRLEISKGVRILKEIAEKVDVPIKIVGQGVLFNELKNISNLELLGHQSQQDTFDLMRRAKALIFPSIWYEGMPMTILEAFANKTLVVSSNLGAMQSMIKHKENGLLFEPNNALSLIKQLNFIIDYPDDVKIIISNSYQNYLKMYSKEAKYKALLKAYNHVILKINESNRH